MVYAVMSHIKEIYSIELNETYYRNAQKRFAGYPNINIFQGQSSEVLTKILKNINKPCLFRLDAHYSGGSTAKGELETPIIQEMQCILNHPMANEHVILIDDAWLFVGENDYSTLEKLERLILGIRSRWTFEVKNDIIRTYSNKIKL